MPESIASLLERVRKELVGTETRNNRLVHVNRDHKKQGKFLNIINERSDDIFDLLQVQVPKKRMNFGATAKESDEDTEYEDIRLDEEEEEEFDEARYRDTTLETPLTPDALQKRLLSLAKDSRTLEEEQGINSLYLALGFLEWYENKNSEIKRESPLILLPVKLERDKKSSTYKVVMSGDDIETNFSLQERLKKDFGINLPDIEDSEDFQPSAYFDKIREIIAREEKWLIHENGMQLGFFSFSKLLMWRDLDPKNWSSSSLENNTLVSKILSHEGGFEREIPLFEEGEFLDDKISPENLFYVVDADTSQTKVIEEVRSGRNLIVQGPPGTGKSQTITNILAAAAYDGKTVLFIAEKMAALKVVYNRMVKVGLRDLCLELHSKKANKKAFLEELKQTLDHRHQHTIQENNAEELRKKCDELNEISRTLHLPLTGRDYSPYDAIAKMIRLRGRDVPAPTIQIPKLETLTKNDIKDRIHAIEEFVTAYQTIGSRDQHPLRSMKKLDLQPTGRERLDRQCEQAISKIDDLISQTKNWFITIPEWSDTSLKGQHRLHQCLLKSSEAPESIIDYSHVISDNNNDKRFHEALENGFNWVRNKRSLSSQFSETAWEYPAHHIRIHLAKGIDSLLSRLFGKYKSASQELKTIMLAPLPQNPRDRLALVDHLIKAQKNLSQLSKDEPYLKPKLNTHWRGENTPFEDIKDCSNWVKQLSDNFSLSTPQVLACVKASSFLETPDQKITHKIKSCDDTINSLFEDYQLSIDDEHDFSDVPLEEVRGYIETIKTNLSTYYEWVNFRKKEDQMKTLGLAPLLEHINNGDLAPEKICDEFEYALADKQWEEARQERPHLNDYGHLDRSALVSEFCRLDRQWIDDVKNLIRTNHLNRLPQGTVGEMGTIRDEISKKRGHIPIRKMMKKAGSMVQRIKPIFFMSPFTVAKFLPPERLTFDLLVLDEASQIRPEDAFGAIARSQQIIIVGDQKQLPPTSFFDSLTLNTEDEEEEEGTARVGYMESILSLCEARGISRRMLEWHYRSKDPSLIEVSNVEFYENRLILPPSPVQRNDDFGLHFRKVSGVYSSKSRGGGRPQTNRIEAEKIAEFLVHHAQTTPDLSLGVVAFSKKQADMINEVLELTRRKDKTLDDFLREGKAENVFVKNIENVQGDERDVIVISVCYGPHEPGGRLGSMKFGINKDGDERRLNVLFTRARIRCDVFCSFDPSEIDLNRTTKEGPRILKKFLDFAKTGFLNENITTGEEADSPFEEDVAAVIRRLGYTVNHQVGTTNYRIDLGIINPEKPGQYILAVECDGATYHSSLLVREKDRMRQEILESHGWKFYRIWSTDWFQLREDTIKKLENALNQAVEKASEEIKIDGANSGSIIDHEETHDMPPDLPPVILNDEKLQVPAYKRAELQEETNLEPHEISRGRMGELVGKIVAIEGPIHCEEVARRVTSAFGKSKAGARIQEAVTRGLKKCRQDGILEQEHDFWMTAEQRENVPIRNRTNENQTTANSKYLSPLEIQAAKNLITKENGDMDDDEMIKAISRLLGYQRAGPDFKEKVKKILTNN